MSRARTTPFNVLLVEDEPADAKLIEAAFAAGSFACRLEHVCDGMAAMEHLNAAVTGSRDIRLPDLMLLDLNMPRKNGHEVLAEMRADIRLREIPVVVLTTSQAEHDINAAYRAGASSYVTKPMELDALFRSIQGIQDFWFGLAQLPR